MSSDSEYSETFEVAEATNSPHKKILTTDQNFIVQHNFVKTWLSSPTYCQGCSGFIWGLTMYNKMPINANHVE